MLVSGCRLSCLFRGRLAVVRVTTPGGSMSREHQGPQRTPLLVSCSAQRVVHPTPPRPTHAPDRGSRCERGRRRRGEAEQTKASIPRSPLPPYRRSTRPNGNPKPRRFSFTKKTAQNTQPEERDWRPHSPGAVHHHPAQHTGKEDGRRCVTSCLLPPGILRVVPLQRRGIKI